MVKNWADNALLYSLKALALLCIGSTFVHIVGFGLAAWGIISIPLPAPLFTFIISVLFGIMSLAAIDDLE